MTRTETKPAPKAVPKAVKAAATPANDLGELPLADLARGVLVREIRPRAADVRRLAEAALAAEERRERKKAGGKKKGARKRKLAKIPGQKPKK